MKINQIINETSTTSGAIATVEAPLVATQTRNSSIYGSQKVGNLLKGKKTKKPYSNSISEGKKVEETKLEEDDLILVPGHGRKYKTGFIPHDQDRTDHEVEMALSDLFQAGKNAEKVYNIIKTYTEEQGLEGWVQEKIIKANDYLNTIREYLEHKSYQQETYSPGGVIAAGGVGESKDEFAGKYKTGKAGQWRNKGPKANKPAQRGDLVGANESVEQDVSEEKLDEKFKSKQQAKLMFAVAGDKDVGKKTGVSQKVAKEFIKKSHGQKVKDLPKKVSKTS